MARVWKHATEYCSGSESARLRRIPNGVVAGNFARENCCHWTTTPAEWWRCDDIIAFTVLAGIGDRRPLLRHVVVDIFPANFRVHANVMPIGSQMNGVLTAGFVRHSHLAEHWRRIRARRRSTCNKSIATAEYNRLIVRSVSERTAAGIARKRLGDHD